MKIMFCNRTAGKKRLKYILTDRSCAYKRTNLKVLSYQSKTMIPTTVKLSPLSHHSSLDNVSDVATLPASKNAEKSKKLKRRRLIVFDSDNLQYQTSIKSINHSSESKNRNPGDCFYFLEQYTRG